MKLADWLGRYGVKRAEFARRIGVSPGAVTQICRDASPWISRETAERIVAETRGAVTPNDFLALLPPQTRGPEMSTAVNRAIQAFARGEIVAVTDDDDRENEGDLIVAASFCTPEKMAFIIRNCCGIVCAPLTSEEAKRLNLTPMVATNDAPLGTAFTVSVDVRHGLTTGISAEERTNTVRALANGNSGASDFVRPGHVFPLVAREGGVLMRSGHTEACVDLCRLAGLPPVGVLSELMNDNGTVMRGPELAVFAEQHKLQRINIAELIAYRQARDKLIERVSEFPVESEIGTLAGYAFLTPFDAVSHMAFVHGRIGDGKNVLTRLHRADIIADVFGGAKTIHHALARFKAEGRGVLVLLRDGTAGVPVVSIPKSGDTASGDARTRQWREIGLGAQILKDLGVISIRLLTSSRPTTFVGLSGFGIEIAGTEPVEG
jgi:3,4-dihydroxy 2-butanone 4-phosphate synthase / GTP cyclohydrolase II